MDDPSLASAQDTANLKTDREVQEYFLNLIQLSLFEIAWYAHKHGQIPPDYFQSWTTRIWQLSREPAFRGMIDNPSMKIMHDDFDSYLRDLINSATPPKPPGRARLR